MSVDYLSLNGFRENLSKALFRFLINRSNKMKILLSFKYKIGEDNDWLVCER